MNQYPRTLDGKHISANMSGFTQYSTESIEPATHPAPAIQPSDLIAQVRALEKTLSIPEIDAGIHHLYRHITDKNNPHNTDLDQFTMEVADVLYQEYIRQGGTGSKEYYLRCLFQVLRIATIEEMKSSSDPNLLVSIGGANRYIRKHDIDPEAHVALFEKLFPGEPINFDPSYVIMSEIGISEFDVNLFQTPVKVKANSLTGRVEECDFVPYSYTGEDGYIHYCTRDTSLPMEYINGVPMIPCFGNKCNEIFESTNFDVLKKLNTTVMGDSEMAPDKTTSAAAIFTTHDNVPNLHSVILPNVFLETGLSKTFSVYAKMESCRYLCISYKDLSTSIIDVFGIYDLETGLAICINGMNRYTVHMNRLSNGWFRCEFTMYHAIGQKADLKMTFFKEKTSDYDFTFKAKDELMGYLWGIQLEDTACASPYIPTTGKPALRIGLGMRMVLDEDWWTPYEHTLVVKYFQPRIQKDNSCRPLLRITNEQDYPALLMDINDDADLVIERYENVTMTSGADEFTLPISVTQDILPKLDDYSFVQLVYGFNKDGGILKRDNSEIRTILAPEKWEPGTRLYIGCSSTGMSLDGYIHTITIYPTKVTDKQATFINGEEIHG